MFAIVAAVLLAAAPAPTPIEGVVTEDSLAPARASVNGASDGDTVQWRINSPGGSAFATMDFISDMQVAKAKKHLRIECHVNWLAASAAAVIFESGLCDVRTAERHSMFLFHGAAGMAGGKAGSLEDAAKLCRLFDKSMAELVAPRLHMTAAQYLAWIEQRDRFLSYDELAAIGGLDVVAQEAAVKPVAVQPAPPPARAAGAVQVASPEGHGNLWAWAAKVRGAILAALHHVADAAWALRAQALRYLGAAAAGAVAFWAIVLAHHSTRRDTALPVRRRAARGPGRKGPGAKRA